MIAPVAPRPHRGRTTTTSAMDQTSPSTQVPTDTNSNVRYVDGRLFGNIEPVYTLAVAAEIIPFPSKAALYIFLGKHKDIFVARYRRRKMPNTRLVTERLLTESEILKIREMTYRSRDVTPFRNMHLNKGRPRRFPQGILGAVMQRALVR